MIPIKTALKTVWHTCDAANMILDGFPSCTTLVTHEIQVEKPTHHNGYYESFCGIETRSDTCCIGRYCEACGKATKRFLEKENPGRTFNLVKIPNIDRILKLLKD